MESSVHYVAALRLMARAAGLGEPRVVSMPLNKELGALCILLRAFLVGLCTSDSGLVTKGCVCSCLHRPLLCR
jgi:hypothetical protein